MIYINKRRLCPIFLATVLLVVAVLIQRQQASQIADKRQALAKAPKDYVLPSTVSRVKQLITHFEMTEKSARDVKFAQTTSVVLSLSQSASKLYALSHGSPLDVKCNRYIRLISLPNVRNVATISALMRESIPLNELVQTDANLIARLTSERDFDSLARIQTIVQTLESEKVLGKSNFEPIVEKELLDCINYYVYRHQSAVENVINYVRNSKQDLSKHLVEPTESEVFVEKFREPIERILSIERNLDGSSQFDYDEWIKSLDRLQTLASQSDFVIPQLARDFLAETQRVDRLDLWLDSSDLKEQILRIEPKLSWFNKNSEESRTHRNAIRELHNLCSNPAVRMRPPYEHCKILEETKRAKIVNSLLREQNQLDVVKPAPEPSKIVLDAPQEVVVSERVANNRGPCPSGNESPFWIENLFSSVWTGSGKKKNEPCKTQT